MRIPQRQPQRRLWKRCKEQFPKCLSLLLVFALTAPLYSYAFVYAAEDSESTGLCKHHPEHTADCGYTEAAEARPCGHEHDETCGYEEPSEGVPCGHIHDESCGYVEAAEETPCDLECTDEDGNGVIDHVPECAWRPAADEQECGHIHDEACGYIAPSEGVPCGHIHDETCGWAEAVAGTPCGFVCEECAAPEKKLAASWTWADEDVQVEWNDNAGCYALGIPGASEETPVTSDVLNGLLPQTVLLQFADGASETVSLSWDLSAIPAEGVWSGSYTFAAALPEGFDLAEGVQSLAIKVELGGNDSLALYKAIALNNWTWEGLAKQGTDAVIYVDITDIKTAAELADALKKLLPKRIYGSSMGDTKQKNDGPYTFHYYDDKVSPTRTWGYLEVDWRNLTDQINNGINSGLIDLNTPDDFEIEADKPTWPGTTYIINNGWGSPEIETMPITIRPFSLNDYIIDPANPQNVKVNLFDYWVEEYGQKPTEENGGDILQKSDWHIRRNADALGNPIPGETNTAYSTKQDWNKGINKGHLLLFGDGLIHAGLWNKGAGQSTQYGNIHAGMEDIVQKRLGEDGYPVLNTE